jgi:hypothetical protein
VSQAPALDNSYVDDNENARTEIIGFPSSSDQLSRATAATTAPVRSSDRLSMSSLSLAEPSGLPASTSESISAALSFRHPASSQDSGASTSTALSTVSPSPSSSRSMGRGTPVSGGHDPFRNLPFLWKKVLLAIHERTDSVEGPGWIDIFHLAKMVDLKTRQGKAWDIFW